jgi:predicted secreted protein
MAKFVCDSGTMIFVGADAATIGATMCLNNATVDLSADTISYQCMGASGNWQANAPGPLSWTCSFESALDDTVGIDLTNTIGQEAQLTFDTVDGPAYIGNAIITSVSINAPVDDYATVSWEATGNGQLAESFPA